MKRDQREQIRTNRRQQAIRDEIRRRGSRRESGNVPGPEADEPMELRPSEAVEAAAPDGMTAAADLSLAPESAKPRISGEYVREPAEPVLTAPPEPPSETSGQPPEDPAGEDALLPEEPVSEAGPPEPEPEPVSEAGPQEPEPEPVSEAEPPESEPEPLSEAGPPEPEPEPLPPREIVPVRGDVPDKPYIGTLRKKPRPAPRKKAPTKAKTHRRILLAAGALAAAAIFTASLILLPPLLTPDEVIAYAQGWSVTLDDRPLGVVADQDAARQLVDGIFDGYRSQYGMDVNEDVGLSFEPVSIEEQYLCSLDSLQTNLQKNIAVTVNAWSIYVNDRRAVSVSCQSDAVNVLMGVLEPYMAESLEGTAGDSIDFLEKVDARQEYVSPDSVLCSEDALRVLTMGSGVQDNWYTVESGDSLAKIAKKFSVKVSDIRQANPSVASTDVIHPGDRLNVVLPRNWINVIYTRTVSGEEVMPYESTTVNDDSMYTTQTKVSQKGVDGKRYVVSEISYINGLVSNREILLETVLEAPVNEIVRKGTQKIPAIVEQASSGRFPLPLKAGTYVISSRFGKRTLNGVEGFHYGLDLAADTGTPIYASMAGTVTYAGSASGYGLVVYIDHGNGVQTRYGHCSKLLVKKGATVKKGELIALVGSTGHSTGPHCHFEVRVNGVAVNPLG